MGNFFQIRARPCSTPPGEKRGELGSDDELEADSNSFDVMDYVSDPELPVPTLGFTDPV